MHCCARQKSAFFVDDLARHYNGGGRYGKCSFIYCLLSVYFETIKWILKLLNNILGNKIECVTLLLLSIRARKSFNLHI